MHLLTQLGKQSPEYGSNYPSVKNKESNKKCIVPRKETDRYVHYSIF